ncbi:hypothetical protein BHE74_00049640 [Ensete ventricosum]|uniref:Uncharacterized protein n=1 Tax=Ensete ventricosum TaxID=4639 RepID=A0A427ALM3_ENSVE|nr:hypothetical protein B296_00017866 [Ensete ventricosum]RWW44579.1 hypothetical protein BHE74_00049640 [Ensete ventricosum]
MGGSETDCKGSKTLATQGSHPFSPYAMTPPNGIAEACVSCLLTHNVKSILVQQWLLYPVVIVEVKIQVKEVMQTLIP